MRRLATAWFLGAGAFTLCAVGLPSNVAAQNEQLNPGQGGEVPFAEREVFPESVYNLGDDPAEGSISPGDVVGSKNTFGNTFDSFGPSFQFGGGQASRAFLDLTPEGDPVYAGTSGSSAGGNLGVEFDGQDDYLWTGAAVESPTDLPGRVEGRFDNVDQYPYNYGTFSNGLQFWATPSSTNRPSEMQDGQQVFQQQMVVANTSEHRIYIDPPNPDNDEDNEFRWASTKMGAGNGDEAVVDFDQQNHVMRWDTGNTRALLVDGKAVAADEGFFHNNTNAFVIGGDTFSPPGADGDPPPVEDPYKGTISKAEFFLFGDAEDGEVEPAFDSNGNLITTDDNDDGVLDWAEDAHDWGDIDLNTDNEWIAKQWQDKGVDPASLVADADIDMDGELSGDADLSTEDDVSEFVDNWLFSKEVDGTQIGDWETRQAGDLNYDGIVNTEDWTILARALIQQQGSAPSLSELNLSVPEPASLSLLLAGGGMMLAGRSRRRRA